MKYIFCFVAGVLVGVFANEMDMSNACKAKGEFTSLYGQHLKCQIPE